MVNTQIDAEAACSRAHNSQFPDEWKEVADWLTARRMRNAVAAALKPIMDNHALDAVNSRRAHNYRGRLADAAIAAIIPLVRAAERERDALAAENARLQAALRESIEDNMWNAYHIGIVKDGKWMDGGMSDAEGLRRELGLADGWHDAEAIQDAIPAAAANAVARVVRS